MYVTDEEKLRGRRDCDKERSKLATPCVCSPHVYRPTFPPSLLPSPVSQLLGRLYFRVGNIFYVHRRFYGELQHFATVPIHQCTVYLRRGLKVKRTEVRGSMFVESDE